MKQPFALLLTATIDPGLTPFVVRKDVAVRMNDYATALRYWLEVAAFRNIVFCENSGHDLSELKSVAAQFTSVHVEFLSFSGNQGAAMHGKGYGEFEIIEHALKTSEVLRSTGKIIKCTGRLSVRNAKTLIPRVASSRFDVMCALRRYLTFADSRLFGCSPRFLEDCLFPQLEKIDDKSGFFFEHALARAAVLAVGHGMNWCPFPDAPAIQGVSGTLGSRMGYSVLDRVRDATWHRLYKLALSR